MNVVKLSEKHCRYTQIPYFNKPCIREPMYLVRTYIVYSSFPQRSFKMNNVQNDIVTKLAEYKLHLKGEYSHIDKRTNNVEFKFLHRTFVDMLQCLHLQNQHLRVVL